MLRAVHAGGREAAGEDAALKVAYVDPTAQPQQVPPDSARAYASPRTRGGAGGTYAEPLK